MNFPCRRGKNERHTEVSGQHSEIQPCRCEGPPLVGRHFTLWKKPLSMVFHPHPQLLPLEVLPYPLFSLDPFRECLP